MVLFLFFGESTIFMQTQTIESRRARDHDRYIQYMDERTRLDEITNASERIAAPMENSFEYELQADGDLWFQGQSLRGIFDRSIAVAEEIVRYQPTFATELVRRRIERGEYNDECLLALGGEDDADVLAVLSTPPDTVDQGIDLGAYDKERKKTLVRIHMRTAKGVRSTSLSLDRSDHKGLQAIANLFGQSIADDATSEDILAMRLCGYSKNMAERPQQLIRRTYDESLAHQYGGQWYAGRQDDTVLDAKAFIEGQQDLIAEHLIVIGAIKLQSAEGQVAMLERARYNFAAAITRRMRGDVDAMSLSEAGDIAEQNGEEYKNDCPEGTSAAQALNQLGYGDKEMKCVTCPYCDKTVDAKLSHNTISCPECKVSVNTKNGRVSHKAEQKSVVAPISVSKELPSSKETDIREKYGEFMDIRTEIGIGGIKTFIYNRRTAKDVAEI